MKDPCTRPKHDVELDVTANGKYALTDGCRLVRRSGSVVVDHRVNGWSGREWQTGFVVLLQHTGQHHARDRRVRRQVAAHAVPILENDAIRRLCAMVGVDALVLDEGHVERTVDVQAVLLRQENILRYQIRTVHGGTRCDVEVHEAILLAVELTVTTVRVRICWEVRWWRRSDDRWRLRIHSVPQRVQADICVFASVCVEPTNPAGLRICDAPVQASAMRHSVMVVVLKALKGTRVAVAPQRNVSRRGEKQP